MDRWQKNEISSRSWRFANWLMDVSDEADFYGIAIRVDNGV